MNLNMNERILELAKQAGLKFPSETAMSPVELKFAELIVKECAKVAERADHSETEIRCMYEVVTEHFGFEE
jgi:hypothetical protein